MRTSSSCSRPPQRLRWDVSVGGVQHLPKRSGALLVTNSRHFSLSTVYSAWALSKAIGRPVRFGGRPDIAPLGPFMQRLGGLLNNPDEISGALRAGELVVVSAQGTRDPRHAGPVDPALIGAAVASGRGGPSGRVDEHAVRPRRSCRGRRPRCGHGESGAARWPKSSWPSRRSVSIQRMIDGLGGLHTGVAPIDWLAEG